MFVLNILFSLLTISILGYLIKLIIWAIRAAKLTANIPGPKPWPILGNALLFAKVKTPKDMFVIIDRVFHKYYTADRIYKMWLGPKLMIMLGDHKHIETVLSSQDTIDKDEMYKYFQIFANGVLTSNGSNWEELRKPLDKLLTKKLVETNIDMFHEKATLFCKILNRYAESGENFNLKHYVMNYTVDILSMSNFGYDLNELDKEKWNIAENFDRGIQILFTMMVQLPHCLSLSYAKLSSEGKEVRKLVKICWNVCSEMLQGRKEKKKTLGEGIDDKPTLFSDFLLQKATHDNLSWDEIGRLAADFIIAGTDAPSVVISHTLLLLAMFPEYQENVFKEQVDILGEDPKIGPTREQLSEMTYLTRVLKEVMRLYSPPIILRKVSKDIDLGKYKLPKGSTAFISFYNLHRDPTNWSHPHEFYPDHFLPEEVNNRPKGAYVPFSWGPRMCPGKRYAMTLMKIIVSSAIIKYKLETDVKFDQLKFKLSFLLESANGYVIRIKPRQTSRK